MKRKLFAVITTLLLLAVLAPANASTWRSTSGNIFHFYSNGTIEGYINGQVFSGRWWWSSRPYQFQFPWYGRTATVNIKGNGGICYVPGYQPTYWTMLGSRGAKDDKPDNVSWFMENDAPTASE
ncbi:MAG TPA: hypothetical protein EYO33_20230 [Phycisphaerales bacterium]|nr:hypothetical protein [Phycisphaerales bacterium]